MTGNSPGPGETILYLHIPKTGGTTLESCIYDQWSTKDCVSDESGYFHSGIYYYPFEFFYDENFEIPEGSRKILRRKDLRAVLGHFFFGIHRHVKRAATYITLLRHPVDRVLSLYWQEEPGRTIEEFMTRRLRETDNDQTRRISGMCPPFGECTKEMLEMAKRNLIEHFAVVGTTEKFDEALVFLQRYLRWGETPVYLPHVVNLDKSKSVAPKPHEVSLIAERNQFDLALYEFACILLEGKISEEAAAFDRDLEEFRSRQTAFLRRYPPTAWPNHISRESPY